MKIFLWKLKIIFPAWRPSTPSGTGGGRRRRSARRPSSSWAFRRLLQHNWAQPHHCLYLCLPSNCAPHCPTPGRVFLTIALVVPSATFVSTEPGLPWNVGCQQSSSNKHLASCPRLLEMLCCNSFPQSIVGVMIQACMVGVIFRSVHEMQNQTLQQWTFTFLSNRTFSRIRRFILR